MRRAITAAGALWALAVACSDGSELSSQLSANAAAPDTPGAGVLTGNTIPVGGGPGEPTPAEGSTAAPESSGAGAPASATEPNPVPVPPAPADPSASGAAPQPNATETNFFSAGCRSDADCGENRRCELVVDSEADAAPRPPLEDAGSPDAGADAGAPEPLVPRGHCVAR